MSSCIPKDDKHSLTIKNLVNEYIYYLDDELIKQIEKNKEIDIGYILEKLKNECGIIKEEEIRQIKRCFRSL